MASTLADQQKNHGLDQHGTTRIRHGFMIYQHSRWGVHFRTRLNISPKLELLPWAKWCVPFCLPCINVSNWCFFQVLLNGESTGCTWIQGRQLGETTTHFAIWKAIPQQGMNFTPRRFVGHGFFPFLFFHSFRLLLVLMILQASWPSTAWTCQMVRPLNVGLVRTRMQSSWSCTRQKVRTTWLADWPVCMNYEYVANSKTRFVIDLKTCWAVACQVFARRPTAPSECCRIQGVVGCRGKASSARGCLSVPCQGSSWESYPPRLAYKQQATQGALETSARLQSTRISGLHMFALSEVREMWYCGTHAWSTRVVHQLQPEHPELWHPVGSVTVDATGAWCHTCVAWLDPIRPDLCHLTKSNCP